LEGVFFKNLFFAKFFMFKPDSIIVTIAPEASLKSFFVRRFIEKTLRRNIKLFLKAKNVPFDSIKLAGARFVIVTGEPKKAFKLLKKCFGVHSLALTQEVPFDSLEELTDKCAKIVGGEIKKGTFAVKGKSYSKKFNSKDIENALGKKILEVNPKLKVNLGKPEKKIYCLAFGDKAFVYFEMFKGAGGLPVGSQGAVGLLANGKKDLGLAWLLLKNGCSIKIVGKTDLKKIEEWGSFKKPKQISIEEAKKLYSEGKIRAFFTSETSLEKISEMGEELGTKVFAPLIFNPSKTPFG
jgi:adenylyl- and sulfurtransferase ThiI